VIHGPHSGSYWALVAAWWAMMAVMMLPVTWPWLRALRRLSGSDEGGSARAAAQRRAAGPSAREATLPSPVVPAFATGYLVIWLGFSLGAAGLQLLVAPHGEAGAFARAGILLAAGLYQLTPAKGACLRHCRSPVAVLLARWPLTVPGSLRMGAVHGLFCLGCCWALMLVALGAGAAGWIWMAGLVLLVAAEKLTRAGPRVGRWAGAALLGAGALYALGGV
jgi:predicted metal-binding membrane protein